MVKNKEFGKRDEVEFYNLLSISCFVFMYSNVHVVEKLACCLAPFNQSSAERKSEREDENRTLYFWAR